MQSFQLALLAAVTLGPSLALCIYIYRKDRVEKEPIGLLLLLFVLGALICYPAGFLNSTRMALLESVYSGGMTYAQYARYLFLENIVGVGLVEEGLKWLVVFLVTHNNRNFNSLFDGVIYPVFVSLGFATLENVDYVLKNGMATAIARALTAVPGHMLFAVCMGIFYSEWHARRDAYRVEEKLNAIGAIRIPGVTKFPRGGRLALSLIVPMVGHGVYDSLCDMMGRELPFSWILFLAFLIGLYIFGFSHVRKLSRADTRDGRLAVKMVNKAYPGVLRIEGKTAVAEAGGKTVTIGEDMSIKVTAPAPAVPHYGGIYFS